MRCDRGHQKRILAGCQRSVAKVKGRLTAYQVHILSFALLRYYFIQSWTCPLALRQRHLRIILYNKILSELCLIKVQRPQLELITSKDLLWIRAQCLLKLTPFYLLRSPISKLFRIVILLGLNRAKIGWEMLLHISLIVLIKGRFIIFPINHLGYNIRSLIIRGKNSNCFSQALRSDVRISKFITSWVVTGY